MHNEHAHVKNNSPTMADEIPRRVDCLPDTTLRGRLAMSQHRGKSKNSQERNPSPKGVINGIHCTDSDRTILKG